MDTSNKNNISKTSLQELSKASIVIMYNIDLNILDYYINYYTDIFNNIYIVTSEMSELRTELNVELNNMELLINTGIYD